LQQAAPLLTCAALLIVSSFFCLQEIVSIYPLLAPPALTAHASNRVCNALALLQCVASHPETRGLFLQGEPAGWDTHEQLAAAAADQSSNIKEG
jgi:hypothetical protein